MNKFTQQNKFAIKKKRRRWQPKGRQADPKLVLEIQNIIGHNNYSRFLLIEYLHLIQEEFGVLRDGYLVALAELIRIPLSEVYEVATFYAHFKIVKDPNYKIPETTIRVCESLTCEMFGSNKILKKLLSLNKESLNIVPGPCMGRCQHAPTVSVGKNYVDKADIDKVLKLVENKKYNTVIPEYINFKDYRAQNGYEVFNNLINKKISVNEIRQIIEKSGLKGKGGAGFPTSKKWEFVINNKGPRYLAVNADEGEPGTFKDRHYLESDPHRFLEGLLISSKIIDAKNVYIYLRDEYPAALEILKKEIQELVNNNIIERHYIKIRRGAGAYICGEESAMIESIEGKRGLPRHRPPYVAQVGLFGKPTLVNNVETIYWLRDIIENGAAWYADKGKNGRKGFHSFSVSGRVQNPGVKIAPAGTTVQELIDNHSGGMMEGHKFKAYLPGGASGGILPASFNNIPLDYGEKELENEGCFLGSAAVIILSDKDKMKDVGINLMHFFEEESCGQCTPCRVGTEKTVKAMKQDKWNRSTLEDLSIVMAEASICGLGQAATNPLKSIIKHFPEELELYD
ncbi:MAG: NADH-quinone oxidoreductase subunit F [Pelagibacteraceae bacterium]|nr:NADH-quinone oxidoreductase subunit F [Pelagibacteraceae bacterium]|tara:strand:- start:5535 stop:7241 length:1707 start_codon:yes stop_codon:yes gene_type:complete